MREMRDRAANLFITVGPSPIGTSVDNDAIRYVRLAAEPKVETPTMRKYREAFHARPARTNRLSRLIERVSRRVSAWI